jgi:hypothetical protein
LFELTTQQLTGPVLLGELLDHPVVRLEEVVEELVGDVDVRIAATLSVSVDRRLTTRVRVLLDLLGHCLPVVSEFDRRHVVGATHLASRSLELGEEATQQGSGLREVVLGFPSDVLARSVVWVLVDGDRHERPVAAVNELWYE